MRKFNFILFFCMLIAGLGNFSVQAVAAQSVDVYDFKSFSNALMNSSVTEINVKSSFTFTRNIDAGIPNRNLTINGNADNGVVINSNMWSIYGRQNTSGKNTLSIINANIVGRGTPGKDDFTDGRFFTGGQENGPNAYGWDVYAKDVKYVGARFVHLSNGTLTFDGNNEIYTNCENAWVNHVVFKAGSTYKSSNSGTGDYAAFYFNRGKGNADGTATLENGAKTYFNIGTYVQPVFTGDVYKTTIGQNAIFDVNTLGHGIWYVAGSGVFYQKGNPEFNVENGAVVNIKQVAAAKVLNSKPSRVNYAPDLYVPVYFAKSGEPEVPGTINVKPGASFYVSGKTIANSAYGVIRMGTNSVLNIDKAADFDIRNNAVGSPAITANAYYQKFTINLNSDIKSWTKTKSEGFYDDNKPVQSYKDILGKINMVWNYTESNQTNNTVFNSNFLMNDFGRIALKGGINEHVVSFDSQGGTAVLPQTIVQGGLVNSPTPPTKNGSVFKGWYKEKATTTPWNFSTDKVSSNVTLYAKWELNPVTKYSVTFDSQGGSTVDPQNVDAGSLVTLPTPPTKDGSVFKGWYKEKATTTPWNFSTDKVSSDVTLYAKWELNPVTKYSVTFDSQGGSTVDPQNVDAGSLVTVPTPPTKNGSVFKGWYKEKATTTPWNFSTDKVSSDVTLYAKWELNPVTKYSVTFDSQGGSTVDPQNVDAGSLVTVPTPPTKNGSVFKGWYKEKATTTPWNFSTDKVSSDVTLYAKWELNPVTKYSVTFDSQGGSTVDPQNVDAGSLVTVPTPPTKNGSVFKGWYKEKATTTPWDFSTDTVSSDVTLYAKWEVQNPQGTHTVTFDSVGGTPVAPIYNVGDGALVTRPNDPTKDGFCFFGWYLDANYETRWNFNRDKVYSDITLYALWNDL